MSNIQESFNQMLMAAQIGAGLYAHSSVGKEKAELRKLIKEDIPKNEKEIELAGDNIGPESSEKEDQVFTEALKRGTEQSKRLFELKSTEKNFKDYKGMLNTLEEWEETVKESQQKREKISKMQPSDKNYDAYIKAKRRMESDQDSKRRYLQEKELYRKIVENDPNPLGINKTKINLTEEEKDGK